MARRGQQQGYTGPTAQMSVVGNPISMGNTGAGLEALGGAFLKLMHRAADAGDREARNEAALSGRKAGLAKTFSPMDEGTIVGAAFNDAARDTYSRTIEMEARTKIEELTATHSADPVKLREALTEYRDTVAEGIEDDVLKVGFQVAFEPFSARAVGIATDGQRRVIADQNRAAVISSNKERFRSYTQLMRDAGRGDASALALAQGEREGILADMVKHGPTTEYEFGGQKFGPGSGAFTVQQMQDVLEKLDAEGTEQGIQGWWEGGPIAQERADKWYAAPAPGVSQDQKDRLYRFMLADVKEADYRAAKAERLAEKAEAEGNARFLSDFQIRLHRGEVGYREVEEAYEAGKVKPGQRAEMTIFLDRRREKDEAAAALAGYAAKALQGDATLDPRNKDHRDAATALFLNESQGWQAQGFDQAEQKERTIALASRLGIMPEPLQAQIRGQLRAGSVGQRIDAADTLERLRNANPQLMNDFGAEDIELGTMIAQNARLGVPADEAVRRADEALRRPAAERAVLKDQFREVVKKNPSEDFIKKGLNSFAERYVPFVSNPDVPPAMAAEFDTLAADSFARTGDFDTARTVALDTLRRTWGVSAFNGKPAWTKSPPELFYGRPNLSPEDNAAWMREQLVSEWKKGAIYDASAGDPAQRLSIRPHPARPVDKKTGLPLYSVIVKAADGTMSPMLDAKGNLLAWAPDWDTSPAGKTAAKEQADEVEAARKKHAARKE